MAHCRQGYHSLANGVFARQVLGGGAQWLEVKASRGEQPQAQWLLDQMQQRHPELLDRCSRLSADKGSDQPAVGSASDQADHRRNCWKDADAEANNISDTTAKSPACVRSAVR